MAPQKPEPTEPLNWLQRQLQRWRTKPNGDQVAAHIGEGAQHVAVGKNIIQIGSIQLSHRAVVVMIIGVLALVSIGIKTAIDNQQTAQSSQQIAQRLNATATPTPTFTPTPTVTPTATPSPTPTLFPPAGKDETLVVVADFRNPQNEDERDVTADLVEQMRKTLAPYSHIRVERLRRTIPRENGSATAIQIGEDRAISATLMIWGYYVSPPDPELTVHFDIVRQLSAILPTSSTDHYGPANIQPSMFDFKVNLGNELAQLVAFAAGVTLFNVNQHKEAEPLFTTASQVISYTLATDFAQAMHYYRGTNYWYLGRFREAQPDLVAALLAAPPADLHSNDLYPVLLNSIGAVYANLGDKQKALNFFNQALPLMQQAGDKADEAATLNNIGFVYAALGDKQQALAFYNQALPLMQQAGDKADEAATLNNIGLVYATLGDKRQALAFYNQALPLVRQVGNKTGEAATLSNIGVVYDSLGDKQQALAFYNQALPLVQQVGDKAGEATTLNNIGHIYAALGDKQQALDFYNQALPLMQQVGDKAGEATTLNNIGLVYAALGDKQQALAFYNQALLLVRQVGNKAGEAASLNNIGLVYAALGDKQQALAFYNQTLPLVRQVGDKAGEATTLNSIGALYFDLDDTQKALDFFSQALPLRQQVGDRWGESTTRYNMAMIYKALGDLAHAEEQLAFVVALDEALGKPDLADHRAMLEQVRAARQK